jgi:TonB-dependent starch-binding outer membrane protein SusC
MKGPIVQYFSRLVGLSNHTVLGMALLIVLPLLILFTFSAFSQTDTFSTLEGTVINRTTGEPIQNVNIILFGTTYGGTTDEDGKFRLMRIPEGRHTLIFSHLGYATYRLTQDFESGESYFHPVEMFERPIRLDEMEIIGELHHRYERRASDSYLITRRDILESGIHNFGDLLRYYVPRISIEQDGFDLIISLTRETSLAQRYGGRQNPLIILNGINIGTSATNLNGIIRPEEIQQVEVIRGPSAMMFGPEADQGVILIDTIRPPRIDSHPVKTLIFGTLVVSYLLYFVFLW